MLAVSTSMSSGAQQHRAATGNGGGGEIDAAALDLLWGEGAGVVLPPLSSDDIAAAAGPSNADAAGKRPATNHLDASALLRDAAAGELDVSIAEHLAYEYGTRTPGDTARTAPPPEEDEDDDDGEGDDGGEEQGGSGGGGGANVVDDADDNVAAGNNNNNRSRKMPRTGSRKTASGPSESAARAKANRERARRERLNDFVSAGWGARRGRRGMGTRSLPFFLSLLVFFSSLRREPPTAYARRTPSFSFSSYLFLSFFSDPPHLFFSLSLFLFFRFEIRNHQQFAELLRVMAPCLTPVGGGSADGAGGAGGGASTSGSGAAGAGAAAGDAAASAAAAASLLRTDKTSVVADAIRLITALRAENGQLKQLNKFMEQRLASVERERAELLMRAAYAAGVAQNNSSNNGGAGPSTSAAAAAAATAVPPPPLDAAAAVAMLPPPWLPPSDLDTSLDGSKRPPAA